MDQMPAAGKLLTVNGMQMYYETYGAGEPLLLLHAFNVSGVTWARFIPELSKQYSSSVPDLRGHGRSTNPSPQFTHRQAALDLFALLDHLGIQQFRSMGISTGGMTLIHMATRQPARVGPWCSSARRSTFPSRPGRSCERARWRA